MTMPKKEYRLEATANINGTTHTYVAPCGCFQKEHRNEQGKIEYTDEGVCKDHAAKLWTTLPRKEPTE